MPRFCEQCGNKLLDDTRFCDQCGHKIESAPADPDPPASGLPDAQGLAQDLRQSLAREQSVLKDRIAGQTAGTRRGLGDVRQSLRREVDAARSDRPDLGGLGGGGLRSDLDAIRSRLAGPSSSGLGANTPGRGGEAAGPGPLERVEMRDIEVRLQQRSRLNISLMTAGTALIDWLEIENRTNENAENALLRIWITGGYGEQWETTIPEIRAFQTHRIDGIDLPLNLSKMRGVREAEQARLRIELLLDDRKVYSTSQDITVDAFNEWFIDWGQFPRGVETLALFVTPNAPAVSRVLRKAIDCLREADLAPMIEGYQSGKPERVLEIVAGIYAALSTELSIHYSMPPASFERTGQKIRSADVILDSEMGTCLDLALLLAAALESAGLQSTVFVIPGHAFAGCWLVPQAETGTLTHDGAHYVQAIEQGQFLPVEATAFATGSELAEASEAATNHFSTSDWQVGLEITACRRAGLRPLDPGQSNQGGS